VTDLGTAMREAAEDVDVRTGFTGDVLRGGRRRQARRRVGMVLAAVVVVGAVSFGAGLAVRQAPDVPQALDRRLLEPTMGNLANDPARLRAATAVWEDSLTPSWRYDRGVSELRGEPHVYWAATTDVGDAAVVMQEAQVRNQWRTLVGLVGRDPADSALKLLGSTSPGDRGEDDESFQFGPGDRTFLVVDPRLPVYASPSATRDADGVVRRTWQQVPIVDGVGRWTAPEGTDPSTVRLVTSLGPPTVSDIPPDRQLNTRPASSYLRNGYHAQPNGSPTDIADMWGAKPHGDLQVGPPGSGPSPSTDLYGLLKGASMVDIGPSAFVSQWTVHGTTPDGTGLLVGECLERGEPSTLYAVLFRADGTPDRVVRGPAVDLRSPLPVRMRLPDGKGWVVAGDRTVLRYRTSATGEWQGSFTRAAVLPDDAAQVEVDGYVVDLLR
jgi:hypothetical protein